jgi:Cdc6-like AAA superfamily ATPase
MQNSSAELYGLDGSQRSLSSHSPVSFSELYEAKRSFFLPPSLKPRAHGKIHEYIEDLNHKFYINLDAFSDERKSASKLLKLPVWLDDFVTRIKSTLFKDPPLLSTYDTTCAVFAIKCAGF